MKTFYCTIPKKKKKNVIIHFKKRICSQLTKKCKSMHAWYGTMPLAHYQQKGLTYQTSLFFDFWMEWTGFIWLLSFVFPDRDSTPILSSSDSCFPAKAEVLYCHRLSIYSYRASTIRCEATRKQSLGQAAPDIARTRVEADFLDGKKRYLMQV